jgi:hypothetical protein
MQNTIMLLVVDDKISAKLDLHSTMVTAGFGGTYVCMVPKSERFYACLAGPVPNYSKYAPFNDFFFPKRCIC